MASNSVLTATASHRQVLTASVRVTHRLAVEPLREGLFREERFRIR